MHAIRTGISIIRGINEETIIINGLKCFVGVECTREPQYYRQRAARDERKGGWTDSCKSGKEAEYPAPLVVTCPLTNTGAIMQKM